MVIFFPDIYCSDSNSIELQEYEHQKYLFKRDEGHEERKIIKRLKE